MRNSILVVAVLIIISSIPAFSSIDEYMNAIENKQQGFAIYARTDGATEESPIITADDIITYNWSDHTFTLKPEAQKKLPRGTVSGKQFLVVVDGKPAYTGTFVSAFSSIGIPGPVIMIDPPVERGGFYRIQLGYPGQAVTKEKSDPRWNSEVKRTLKRAGKLVAEEYPIVDLMFQKADVVAYVRTVEALAAYLVPSELSAVPGAEVKALVCEVMQPLNGKIDDSSRITFYYYESVPVYGAAKPLMQMNEQYIVFMKRSSIKQAYIVIDRWVGVLPYDESLKDYLAGSAR